MEAQEYFLYFKPSNRSIEAKDSLKQSDEGFRDFQYTIFFIDVQEHASMRLASTHRAGRIFCAFLTLDVLRENCVE